MLETENVPGTFGSAGHLKRIRRPRVDVMVQTSGIVRDMVSNFWELLDEAVVRVSSLEEPGAWNAVRKHAHERMDDLRRELDEKLTASQIRRMVTLRIFSSMPGTYGLGVRLALDTLAWNTAKDPAEVYLNLGSYAYGSSFAKAHFELPENLDNSGMDGIEAHWLLAGQLIALDVSYMKQFVVKYDILDCGGYAVFQGGMAPASQALSGKQPNLYWGDSNMPDDVEYAMSCRRSSSQLEPSCSNGIGSNA